MDKLFPIHLNKNIINCFTLYAETYKVMKEIDVS